MSQVMCRYVYGCPNKAYPNFNGYCWGHYAGINAELSPYIPSRQPTVSEIEQYVWNLKNHPLFKRERRV